ncbi:putative E3 ubiquitin-protein ligase HIP1 [Bienertia sinuspersici]
MLLSSSIFISSGSGLFVSLHYALVIEATIMPNMNERDLLCNTQRFLDLTNGHQVQNHLHPEPCIILGSTPNFPLAHLNQVLPPSGSANNYDYNHLPEHVGRPAFYGMTQYNQPNHPATNHPNFFNAHLDPVSGARVFPVPLNHGFADHLPSSSNYGGNVVPCNEHPRSNYSAEGLRDLYKRKITDGIPGNIQHFSASAGPSSSSATPMNNRHFDSGSTSMEAPPMPDYRGNGTPPMMEVGARHRSGAVGLHMDSNMVHNYNNYLLQGNYGGSNMHSPSIIPPHNLQPRGYGVACYPPFLAAGVQHDINAEPNRPTGIRIYRSQGRNLVPDVASRRRDLPRLRTLQAEGVAVLEFSNYYEVDYNVENFIDHHSDMRLDIDNMSYEELLALSERIGTVNTGLTEKDITCYLKTKRYSSIELLST